MNEKPQIRFINAAAFGLATISLLACFTFWFQLTGKEYGMFYGVFVDPPSKGFASHSPNHFQSINTWYFVISVCLMIFLIVNLMGFSRSKVAARMFAVCVAVMPFVNMLSYKYDLLSFRPTFEGVSQSIYSDWACLAAIAAIIGIEIFTLISVTQSPAKIVNQP